MARTRLRRIEVLNTDCDFGSLLGKALEREDKRVQDDKDEDETDGWETEHKIGPFLKSLNAPAESGCLAHPLSNPTTSCSVNHDGAGPGLHSTPDSDEGLNGQIKTTIEHRKKRKSNERSKARSKAYTKRSDQVGRRLAWPSNIRSRNLLRTSARQLSCL